MVRHTVSDIYAVYRLAPLDSILDTKACILIALRVIHSLLGQLHCER